MVFCFCGGGCSKVCKASFVLALLLFYGYHRGFEAALLCELLVFQTLGLFLIEDHKDLWFFGYKTLYHKNKRHSS